MEACRGQIAASNFIAANSRSLILDAQARINRCEVDIPTRKLELKLHNEKCANELKKMKDRLAIILADIEVMTTILTMTDCDAKSFMVEPPPQQQNVQRNVQLPNLLSATSC